MSQKNMEIMLRQEDKAEGIWNTAVMETDERFGEER